MATTETTQPTAADTARDEQYAIEKRLHAILAIPFAYCPWPEVRNELFQRILSGAPIDVHCWSSATVWRIDDRTYPDAPVFCDPRAWANHNGFTVDGGESA